MFIRQRAHGFDFHENLRMQNKIRFVFFGEKPSFVMNLQLRFGIERNPAVLQFNHQSFLVDIFQKPGAQLVINLEARTDHREDLFSIDQFHISGV